MKTIINDSKDPTFNLALEEYVLKELDTDEDIVMLWQNANSVIVGRNQNTYQEVNAKVVKDYDVKVVRRITGGGAVYHDLGNLNFSFITKSSKNNINNYRKFTEPVINALNELGVPAEFQGRNDIVVNDKKISGNAQAWHNDKLLHHGTILFDVDLNFVSKVLTIKQDKIQSKGIKSNRARVTNILPFLNKKRDILDFKEYLLKKLLGGELNRDNIINIDENMLMWIEEKKKSKYQKFSWNYGESPSSSNVKENRYKAGKLEFHFDLDNGHIKNIKIYGDFLDIGSIEPIEEALEGSLYEYDTIDELLRFTEVSNYIVNISRDEFLDCLFGN